MAFLDTGMGQLFTSLHLKEDYFEAIYWYITENNGLPLYMNGIVMMSTQWGTTSAVINVEQ